LAGTTVVVVVVVTVVTGTTEAVIYPARETESGIPPTVTVRFTV
jgi:hypothetical protein